MEKIYEKGTSVHVGSFRVYAYNGSIYEDAAHEHKVTDVDALKAFQEGRLQIVVSTNLLMASQIALDGSSVSAGGSSYSTQATD